MAHGRVVSGNAEQPVEMNKSVAEGSVFSVEELVSLSEDQVSEMGMECLLQRLHSTPQGGLQDRQQSSTRYGVNRLPKQTTRSLLSFMWNAFKDRILVLLTIAAAVSLGIGIYEEVTGVDKFAWIEGVAIVVSVVVIVLVNGGSDFQRERQFMALSDLASNRAVILQQAGARRQVSVFDVLVGDIVHLQPGDVVPADGVILEGSLSLDESSLTGESRSVGRVRGSMIRAETKVLDGTAMMVVTAVGRNTYHGQMMLAMTSTPSASSMTPLQGKLAVLAETIAKVGLAMASIMLLTLVIKFLVEGTNAEESLPLALVIERLLLIVIQTITIIVVAVPEGLPMAVTIALAYATTRMLQDNNLVRVMASCETMGTATCICTDKTGTLTQNLMSVVDGEVMGGSFREFPRTELLEQSVIVNSTAFYGEEGFVGASTEVALLRWIGEKDVEGVRLRHPIVRQFPFSSERKSMSTIIRHGNHYRILVKGASEVVLKHCTHQLERDGKHVHVEKEKHTQLITRMASQTLRTIALAYRDVLEEAEVLESSSAPPLHHLTLLGILGIADPLREDVRDAVEQCQRAGIFIRMVTGDNLETATAIARNAGILHPGGIAMEGSRFRALPAVSREQVLHRLQVLARSSPLDKQIMVRDLRGMHEIVAVTGDGTNDGPALRAANVGFAMGIAGTEVAKAASSIVLLDDNFSSIVKAVAWGRCINGAVRKFLQFQLTVNITAVTIAYVSAVFDPRGRSVLTAVQLLWVNLVMDTLGALALATEAPTPDLLERLPDSPALPLVTRGMWRMILTQAAFQIVTMLFLIFLLPRIWTGLDQRTVAFNTFVWLQLFNEINCRILTVPGRIVWNPFAGIQRSWMFLVIWLSCATIQVLLVEFGGRAFHCSPLDLPQWFLCLGTGFLSLPIALVVRLVPLPSRLDETIVYQSPERLRWQSAVSQVRTQLSVYKALRGRVGSPVRGTQL